MIIATLEEVFQWYEIATMALFYKFAFLLMGVVVIIGIVYSFYHLIRK